MFRLRSPELRLDILKLLVQFHDVRSSDICIVILAGGQSRRMGFNKALLEVDGRPLIQILSDRMRRLTDSIVISANDPDSYRFLGLPVVPDRFSGHGPLAGLHAAMLERESDLYVLLACDLPNFPISLLKRMVFLAGGFDAAIPRTGDGFVHPLCAVYRRTCFPYIEQALERGEKKFIETFLSNPLSVRWISPEEGPYSENDLANINTPHDLQKLGVIGRR
ncbi:MAG: molybdenum cofactor guanylyltransferase [Acidobacteria bacterium]|nr:molybdenum cofactor guanylyltransferase [Acidobacteriota bacterium]